LLGFLSHTPSFTGANHEYQLAFDHESLRSWSRVNFVGFGESRTCRFENINSQWNGIPCREPYRHPARFRIYLAPTQAFKAPDFACAASCVLLPSSTRVCSFVLFNAKTNSLLAAISVLSQQAYHPSHLDDEIAALTLQLEEISYREEMKKGKYTLDNIPDLEVAYSEYLVEIEAHLAFLKDVKLAHSIGSAIDADTKTIVEIAQVESQAQEDRRVAVQMSSDDPDLEAPPPYTEVVCNCSIEDEFTRRMDTLLSLRRDPHDGLEDEASPSVSYAQRQADVMGKLARNQFECTACGEEFCFAEITQIGCDNHHQYCGSCLKQFIMSGVVNHDLIRLPPRCCGKEVSRAIIISSLTAEELEDFKNAEIEKQTQEKTHGSNPECGRFIAPCYIAAGEATCPRCRNKTCSARATSRY